MKLLYLVLSGRSGQVLDLYKLKDVWKDMDLRSRALSTKDTKGTKNTKRDKGKNI